MDILDDVLLSPSTVHLWHGFVRRVVLIFQHRGWKPEQIPDEQARVGADGTLTIFVVLPDGSEVSMNVPKEHWTYRERH